MRGLAGRAGFLILGFDMLEFRSRVGESSFRCLSEKGTSAKFGVGRSRSRLICLDLPEDVFFSGQVFEKATSRGVEGVGPTCASFKARVENGRRGKRGGRVRTCSKRVVGVFDACVLFPN